MGAPIRMVHIEHGFHHAYDGAEVKRMKENGWEIEKPPAPKVAAPVVAEPAETPVPVKGKGGRPKKAAA